MNGGHPVSIATDDMVGNTRSFRKITPFFDGFGNLLDDGHRVIDPVFLGKFLQCGQRDLLVFVSKHRSRTDTRLQTEAAGGEVVGGADSPLGGGVQEECVVFRMVV